MAEPNAQDADALKTIQRLMQAGDFSSALDQAETLLESGDRQEPLYMASVCARYLQRFEAAQDYLRRLKTASPDYGRAFQEEGHLFKAMGDPARALQAFQHATRCNSALTASWAAQAELLRAAGRPEEASASAAQLDRLNKLPKPLLAVMNHIHEGRVLKAEEIARAFLQKTPHHVEAMRLLADIGVRLGVLEDAELLLEAAAELEPDNVQIRIDYIQTLRKRQKFAAAREQARLLLERDPQSPVFQSLYAIESMQAGDFDTALAGFDDVLRKLPNDPVTLTSRGHALKTCGQTDEAIASYRAALASDPRHGDAWYALANLKTFRFSDEELEQMLALEGEPDMGFMSRVHLAFALGKALEDARRYDEAFTHYARGNEMKRKQTRYTSEQMEEEFTAQKRHCTPELFEKQSGKGCPAPDPIFILGLPRAGSTLLEQILASHSQVDGTLELPNILSLAHRLRGRKQITERDRYPRILHDLTADQLTELGEAYIEETRIHRAGAPFFTDKMPNNFRHIGLIHLILPNAKIIDAQRDPMDCCWSGFKQLFAEGQEFSYSLEDIGRYYRAYVDLMDHWNTVLPEGRILRVQHEDVLDDLEGEVRRMLDYCGLPFEQACINFHRTERAVRTASSEQVRQPISRAGAGRWQPFQAHLEPLIKALSH